ncbi:Nif11 family protein [Bradyrhizobium sp. Arg314]
MPQADVERFINDLGKKGNLLENVKSSATGLASIVAIAKSRDYKITLDEVKSYLRLRTRQKSTGKKLNELAGRKHGSSMAGSTGLVQTTALAGSVTDAPPIPLQVAEAIPVAAVVLVIVIVIVVAT